MAIDVQVDRKACEPAELVVARADGPLTVLSGERQLEDLELSLDAEVAAGAAGLMTGLPVDALDGLAVKRDSPNLRLVPSG